MRICVLWAVTMGLVLAASAHAQQPAASAPPPDYGAPIGSDQAKAAGAAAVAEAKKNNWRLAVVVVGPDGELVYVEKMDGTQNSSVQIAQAKARTAALYRRASKAFADQYNAGNTGFSTFPADVRPIASEGGIPIVVNGKLVGAIGASGGTAQQDGVAATAGANVVK
jgi:uncharacterized protein GlcG (DUF336 family)